MALSAATVWSWSTRNNSGPSGTPIGVHVSLRPWHVLGAVALSFYSAACASTGATPRPFPMPAGPTARRAPAPPPAEPTAPSDAPPVALPGSPAPPPARPTAFDGYALVGTALALRGVPYRNGGSDPGSGFDCSGFTQYVFAQYGVALPREVREQFRIGKPVQPADLVAGD